MLCFGVQVENPVSPCALSAMPGPDIASCSPPVEYWDRISGILLHKEDADAFVRGNSVMHVGIREEGLSGNEQLESE